MPTLNYSSQNASVADLIQKIMELTDYEGHLERTTPADMDNRLENIKVSIHSFHSEEKAINTLHFKLQELQAFAVQIEKDHTVSGEGSGTVDEVKTEEVQDDIKPKIENSSELEVADLNT